MFVRDHGGCRPDVHKHRDGTRARGPEHFHGERGYGVYAVDHHCHGERDCGVYAVDHHCHRERDCGVYAVHHHCVYAVHHHCNGERDYGVYTVHHRYCGDTGNDDPDATDIDHRHRTDDRRHCDDDAVDDIVPDDPRYEHDDNHRLGVRARLERAAPGP